MATGDIRNNLKKLQKELTAIRFPKEIDYEGLTKGDVLAHLPLLYHLFFNYSPNVVENISKFNYNLAGKKDVDFMNVVFKIIRELNPSYHLSLKVKQFMTKGYAEHKIILTMNIIRFIRNCPKLTLSKGKTKGKRGTMSATSEYNGAYVASNTAQNEATTSNAVSANTQSVIPNYRPREPPNTTPPRPSVVRHLNTVFQPNEDASLGLSAASNVDSVMSSSSTASLPIPSINYLTGVAQLDEQLPPNDENLTADDDIYTLVLEISDDLTKMKEMMEKSNQELNVEIRELKSNLESTKSNFSAEKERLKCKVHDLEERVTELEDELKAEKIKQAERPDLETVLARLDIIDSKFKSFEHSQKTTNERPPLSPVCGNNLCSHMKNLHLPAEESVLEMNQVDDGSDNSSLDDANETPCRKQIRQRSAKLIELVQGTRSLLGIDRGLSENLFLGKNAGNSENVPPDPNS